VQLVELRGNGSCEAFRTRVDDNAVAFHSYEIGHEDGKASRDSDDIIVLYGNVLRQRAPWPLIFPSAVKTPRQSACSFGGTSLTI
jgi:hypothetical protein